MNFPWGSSPWGSCDLHNLHSNAKAFGILSKLGFTCAAGYLKTLRKMLRSIWPVSGVQRAGFTLIVLPPDQRLFRAIEYGPKI